MCYIGSVKEWKNYKALLVKDKTKGSGQGVRSLNHWRKMKILRDIAREKTGADKSSVPYEGKY